MPFYTSQIYLEANTELLSFLKSDPILSTGLYHLRQLFSTEDNLAHHNEYPQNGIAVIREVCDPNKNGNDHDEARVHQKHRAPIISWWKLQGKQGLEVLTPSGIPTLAFGKIYINNEHNPHPPLELLKFLKNLSTLQKISIAFYHHYSAYEDELANAEYAWVFGKQESVYIRHIDSAYDTIQYTIDSESKVINSEREGYRQPILHLVMKEFGAKLIRFDDRRPYFHGFNWDDYKI
jgi:hypothetical protein